MFFKKRQVCVTVNCFLQVEGTLLNGYLLVYHEICCIIILTVQAIIQNLKVLDSYKEIVNRFYH